MALFSGAHEDERAPLRCLNRRCSRRHEPAEIKFVLCCLAGGLRERRHRGIPGGQARQTLLHRSQLPPPGRAHGHRRNHRVSSGCLSRARRSPWVCCRVRSVSSDLAPGGQLQCWMVPTRAKSFKYSLALWRRRWQRREAEEREARENMWNR